MIAKPTFQKRGAKRQLFRDPRKERIFLEADAAVETLAAHFRDLGKIVDFETDEEIRNRMHLGSV
jgi:hypothetical protein